jgi:hypothetical protein
MSGICTASDVSYRSAGEIADRYGVGWYIFWQIDANPAWVFRGPFASEAMAEHYKITKLRGRARWPGARMPVLTRQRI